MTSYRPAPEVAELVNQIIEDVPDHKRLAEIDIECVFIDPPAKSKGKFLLGRARKISGLNAFLGRGSQADAAPFAVIEIALRPWEAMTDEQRRALVDHEMCHLDVEYDEVGQPQIKMRGHDLEEFAGVVKRHGFWQSDVAEFSEVVAQQLTFAMEDADAWLRNITEGDDE